MDTGGGEDSSVGINYQSRKISIEVGTISFDLVHATTTDSELGTFLLPFIGDRYPVVTYCLSPTPRPAPVHNTGQRPDLLAGNFNWYEKHEDR